MLPERVRGAVRLPVPWGRHGAGVIGPSRGQVTAIAAGASTRFAGLTLSATSVNRSPPPASGS